MNGHGVGIGRGGSAVRTGRLCGGVALLLTVILAGTAFASSEVAVKSRGWIVGVNDAVRDGAVRPNGSFRFCASEDVGAIEAVVVLRAPILAGAEVTYGVDGPRAAGDSLGASALSTGTGTRWAVTYTPVTFPRLKAHGAGSFPTGTYRFWLDVSSVPAISYALTLERGGACAKPG